MNVVQVAVSLRGLLCESVVQVEVLLCAGRDQHVADHPESAGQLPGVWHGHAQAHQEPSRLHAS